MKRIIIATFVMLLAGVAIDLLRTRAPSEWDEIKEGMNSSVIVETAGKPDVNVLDSKGIQIWTKSGLIRSVGLAVFYYDTDNPDIATRTHHSVRWLWERI
jgi:hypothetical protein